MKTSKSKKISEILNRYNDFSECIINDILFRNFGTSISIDLLYIYSENGQIFRAQDDYRKIRINFNLVQKFILNNFLNSSICTIPSNINWGINEISLMQIKNEDSILEPFKYLPLEFSHLEILWENDRRIDLVFHEFEIIE